MNPVLNGASVGIVALSLTLTGCTAGRLGQESGKGPESALKGPSAQYSPGGGPSVSPSGPGGAASLGASPGSSGIGSGTGAGSEGGAALERTASDRGVTRDQILLGLLAVSESSWAAFGFSYTGKSYERILKPFVDDVNEHGGINGRKLVVGITRFDQLSQDKMAAACVAQAEDLKVFASIASGFWGGEAEVCMANKQVPLLTDYAASSYNYNRERGWVRTTRMIQDRMAKNWVDWAIATGQVTSKTKNGIVMLDVPERRWMAENVLIPYMKKRGLQVTEKMAFSYNGGGDTAAGVAEAQNEAQGGILRFKAAGVELVWPAGPSSIYMAVFTNQADGMDYHPRYIASDLGGLTGDMASLGPSWDGVKSLTVGRQGEQPFNVLPKNRVFRECLAVYKAHGEELPETLATGDQKAEAFGVAFVCEHIGVFAVAARRAGANPTRRSFLSALDGLGTWSTRVTMTERLSFASGKPDSADYLTANRWDSVCGCQRQIEPFRRRTW